MKESGESGPGDPVEQRRQFQKALERCESDGHWFFPGFFAVMFGMMLLGKCPGWIKIFPAASLALGAGMLFRSIRAGYPVCPGCRGSVAGRIGSYCPQCGSRSVLASRFLGYPRCDSCHTVLTGGKGGRGYSIRHCSHCGLLVSEQGF